MCCLCCDIYKGLYILVFSDKDKKPQVLSHSSFTVLIPVGHKKTHTDVGKEQGAQAPMVQYNLSWAGLVLKGLISILGCKSCFIPVTVLTHHGKFNKGIPNLWMKSYSDTIEIKPLWLNICIVLFFSQDCSKRNVDFMSGFPLWTLF